MTEEYERYKAAQAARWLEHVARLGRRKHALEDEITHMREEADGVRAIAYDGMPHAQSDGDALELSVIRLQERIKGYATEIAEYVEAQHEAHEALRKIEDAACAECLTRHYLMGWTWERTCVAMQYSWDGMMGLRRRALASAYEVMPTKWRDPMHSAI